MSLTSPTLLAALRADTRALHVRTEAAFVLGAPSVTRAVYADVLARLAAHYVAAEAALAPWAPVLAVYGLDLVERWKAPLLYRDLGALGIEAGAPVAAPVVPSPAHAWGLLYVLEGATLGGQLLRRRLGPMLGLAPDRGLAFFAAYGPRVGGMWRAFGEAVGRYEAGLVGPARDAAERAAVAAARDAFLAFEREVVTPTAAPTAAAA